MWIVEAGEGDSLNVLADTFTVKLANARSTRQLALITVDAPTAGGVPPHPHAVEDEGDLVLARCLRITPGGPEHLLHPYEVVLIPAHGCRNDGPEPARFLAWTLGGALDDFFRGMSPRVRSLPEDAAALQRVRARFGMPVAATDRDSRAALPDPRVALRKEHIA